MEKKWNAFFRCRTSPLLRFALLTAVLICTASGISGQAQAKAVKPGDEIRIGLTLPETLENGAFRSLNANLDCLSEELPVTFLYSGERNSDTVETVEALIRQGADGIMISRMEEKELPVICGICEEAQVFWGLFLWDILDDDIRAFCEASEYYAGNTCEDEKEAGRLLLTKAYEKGLRRLALISESEWHATCRKRETGILAASAELPGISVLNIVRDLADREDAQIVTENLIQAYPEMDGILLVGSIVPEAAAGIQDGIRSLQAEGRVSLLTIDFSDQLAVNLEEGILKGSYGLPVLAVDPFYLSLILINRIYGTPVEKTHTRCCIRGIFVDSPESAWALEKRIEKDPLIYYQKEELHRFFKWENPQLDGRRLQELSDRFQASLSEEGS